MDRETTHGRSLIAGINALFRQVETERDEGAILKDNFAQYFAERGVVVSVLRVLRLLVPPLKRIVEGLQTVHNVRHCAIDGCILRAYNQGCRQFVLLGAGYDMRVFRFPQLRDDKTCLWVEMDNPATAQRKLQLLKNIPDLATRSQVRRIQTRFERAKLGNTLSYAGVDREQAICFILEGLVHYQTERDFQRICAEMLTGSAHREIILSFITPAMERSAGQWQRRLFTWLREIPVLFLSPRQLKAHFEQYQCHFFEHWDYDAQVAEFAPQARGRKAGVSQDVAHIARR